VQVLRTTADRAPLAGRGGRPAGRSRATSRRRVIVGVLFTSLTISGCTAGVQAGITDDEIAQIETEVDKYLSVSDPEGLLRALLVSHGGELVIERYAESTADDYWNVRSVTKSIMSMLVGIAIADGSIESVDSTLGELLPSFAADLTPEVAAIALRDVLTHTAGFREDGASLDPLWESADWVRTILADRAVEGPGDGGFAYSSRGTHILSAVLVEATGRPVLDFARERLFDPLGIPSESAFEGKVTPDNYDDPAAIVEYQDAQFSWITDPQGYHVGMGFLKLRPQDLMTLGQLYLNEGISASGDRIVPASWVDESTTAQSEGSMDYDYGYQWWVIDADGDPSFSANGFGGQLIQVVPERDLVVVTVAETDDLNPPPRNLLLEPEDLAFMSSLVIVPRFAAD
jgi:CubicO group peptidase (beta-lactamase class C family)